MRIEVYRRADGKWAWRFVAANGQVMASDASQGYENRQDCIDAATLVTGRQERNTSIDLHILVGQEGDA